MLTLSPSRSHRYTEKQNKTDRPLKQSTTSMSWFTNSIHLPSREVTHLEICFLKVTEYVKLAKDSLAERSAESAVETARCGPSWICVHVRRRLLAGQINITLWQKCKL